MTLTALNSSRHTQSRSFDATEEVQYKLLLRHQYNGKPPLHHRHWHRLIDLSSLFVVILRACTRRRRRAILYQAVQGWVVDLSQTEVAQKARRCRERSTNKASQNDSVVFARDVRVTADQIEQMDTEKAVALL